MLLLSLDLDREKFISIRSYVVVIVVAVVVVADSSCVQSTSVASWLGGCGVIVCIETMKVWWVPSR